MLKFVFENALILDYKPLGEHQFAVHFFTKEQGRFVGVLKKKTPPLAGTLAHVSWQARLPEQMGMIILEPAQSFTALYVHDKKRLACVSCVCAFLRSFLPERQSFSELYQKTLSFLDSLSQEDFLTQYVFWELYLLSAVGFGLDLTRCAGGGDNNDLAYVSPNTSRAVCREKGAPYCDKLLILPAFLWKKTESPDALALQQALRLTGFFFEKHFAYKKMLLMRQSLISEKKKG